MSIVFPGLTVDRTIDGAGSIIRASVKAGSNTNINLSSNLDGSTIDGITVNDGDRVILFGQSSSIDNGIYVIRSGAGNTTRTPDFDIGQSASSTIVFIQQGTTYGDTGWYCTNDTGSDIIGTNNLTFIQFVGNGVNGNVADPSGTSTDNAIVRYDGTDASTIQNSGVTLDDNNHMAGLGYIQFNDITAPSNPSAGQGRLYKKAGNDGIFWKPDAAGPEVDLSGGESNTASNVGVGGVGVFKQKTGVDLEFRNINAASNKLSVALDGPNNEIDLNVVESNINILNLSGAPSSTVVGISDTQTLTNKSLVDASTLIVDDGDNTKAFQFQASSITTATTRTITVPDFNLTLVGLTNLQTLTNKTISALSNTLTDIADSSIAVGAMIDAAKIANGTVSNTEFQRLNFVTSAIVGIDDTQTLNNKTLVDATTLIVDDGDNTKAFQFQASGITTATTRTITVPDFNLTLVGVSNSQTLTNKNISGLSNVIGATQLETTGAPVQITSTAPAGSNYILRTTGTTTATWQLDPGGETNTASNVGVGGVGVFKQKSGFDLEFRNINVASSKLSVVLDAPNNEVDLDVVETAVNHNNLLNYVANEHIDHSTVSINAGEALTGGGDITTSRTLALNINGLTADATPDGAADFVVTYDTSAGSHKKVLINNLPFSGSGETNTASNVGVGGVGVFKQKTGVNLEFRNVNAASSKVSVILDTPNNEIDVDVVETAVNHNNLLNYVANEHINHSTVTITAGEGLTGGGDITTSRTLALNINGLTTDGTPDGAADFVVTYDTSAANHKKVLLNNIGFGGQANTASNVGVGGVGVFKQKTGVNLEFRNVNAASSKISVVLDTPNNEIDVDVVETAVNHNNLLNYVANQHINHSTVSINAGTGLTGGGNITATRTLSLNIIGLTVDATPDGAADYIATYDASAATHKRVLLNNIGFGGQANTASNVGVGGVGVFKQKTGVDLEFRNINAASSKVSVVLDTPNNEVDIDVVETNVNHNALLNYVANEHINHSTVTITAGEALTGGGDITTSRTLALNINGLTADATPDGANDFVVTYDASAGSHKKVLLNNIGFGGQANTASNVGVGGVGVFKQKTGVNLEFRNINAASSKISVVLDTPNNEVDIDVVEANVNHNSLLNYVANQHVDHSTVSINSGTGLTGGGNITATRTLSLDINGLTADATPDGAADYVVTYDASATTHKKVLINNLPFSGSGETNTASNVGVGGVGVFKQKTGVDLEFRNVNAASSKISVVLDTPNNEIDLDVVETAVNHNNLLNYVANQHVDHSTVSINAGEGLTGGGNITTSRTLSFNINGLTTDATPDGAADFVVTYDTSAGSHKKVLVSNLPTGGQSNTASNVGVGGVGLFKQKTGVNLEFRNINAASSKVSVVLDTPNNEVDLDVVETAVNHNNLLNYVANQHVDHSTVSINSGTGLTGGGNITATRTISLDINGLVTESVPDAADLVPIYDVSVGAQRKVLLSNIGFGGQANTASNVGVGGVGVFKQKTGVNLEFRNINAASSKISVALDVANNEVDIDAVEANINHNSLLNYVANQHVDHSTVSINAGNGLTGGGDITTSRSLALNINGLTTDTTPDGAADFLVTYDTSAGTHKKINFASVVTFSGALQVQIFRDQKPVGTAGGTFSNGSWITRILNTSTGNITGASLTANQFTLPAGTYYIEGNAPAHRVDVNQTRIQNITAGTTVAYGSLDFAPDLLNRTQSTALVRGFITIVSSTVFELQHQCQKSHNTDGLGLASGFAGTTEVYAAVYVNKIG